MRRFLTAVLIAIAVTVPAPAGADLLFTPYAGLNFGGSSVDTRTNLGGSLAWVRDSGLGVEIDVGFIPDFFEPKDLDLDLFGANNVTTVMGNVLYGRHLGRIAPYVSGGAGLVRTRIGSFGELFDDVATDNGVGVNAGAGVRVGGRRFSLRGDLRYFRNLTDTDLRITEDVLGDFSFWRGTVGVSLGF